MKHFEPGQPVIYKSNHSRIWDYGLYNRITTCGTEHLVVGGFFIKDENILPYNDSIKYLIGTDNDYTEWKPEPNTVIAVRDHEQDSWMYRLFLCIDDKNRYVCKMDGNSTNKHTYEWKYATSIEESLKD